MPEVRRLLADAGAITAVALRIERHVLAARRALAAVEVAWVAPLHHMRWLAMLAVVALATVAVPGDAAACSISCKATNHHQRLQYSDAAFRGRVLATEHQSDLMCNTTWLEPERSYDLFATYRDGELWTGMCSVVSVEDKDADLLDSDRPRGRGCGHCSAGGAPTGGGVVLALFTALATTGARRRRRRSRRRRRASAR